MTPRPPTLADISAEFSRPTNQQPEPVVPTEPVEKTIYIYEDWMTTDELRWSKPSAVRRIRWDGERIVDVTDEAMPESVRRL